MTWASAPADWACFDMLTADISQALRLELVLSIPHNAQNLLVLSIICARLLHMEHIQHQS